MSKSARVAGQYVRFISNEALDGFGSEAGMALTTASHVRVSTSVLRPSLSVIYRSLPYAAQLNSARELYNTTSKITEYLDDSEAYENALDEFERDALDYYAENCKECRCF